MKKECKQAAQLIRSADTLIIHTGAGMGRDSGLPDYRGEEGQWGEVEKENGASVFEVMNPKHLKENPKYGWSKHLRRWKNFSETRPHLGFYIIKEWIDNFFFPYFIQTSNIDGQFQKAGFPKENIRELHGAMQWLQCIEPCSRQIWETPEYSNEFDISIKSGNYPVCPNCGELARPNVYMFRDSSYVDKRSHAQKMHYEAFLKLYGSSNIVVLEIGSGPHVQSIRQKTRELISKYGAKVIRINTKDFKIKEPHIGIKAGALVALKEINTQLQTINKTNHLV